MPFIEFRANYFRSRTILILKMHKIIFRGLCETSGLRPPPKKRVPILFHVEPLMKIFRNKKSLGKVAKKDTKKTPTIDYARKLIKCVNFFPWTDTLATNYMAHLKRKHFHKQSRKAPRLV